MVELDLDPKIIRYSQQDISCRFRNGKFLYEPLRCITDRKTAKELVLNFPPITVARESGFYFVDHGHRRLYVMKEMRNAGLIVTIKVKLANRLTTKRRPAVCQHKSRCKVRCQCKGRRIKIKHTDSISFNQELSKTTKHLKKIPAD